PDETSHKPASASHVSCKRSAERTRHEGGDGEREIDVRIPAEEERYEAPDRESHARPPERPHPDRVSGRGGGLVDRCTLVRSVHVALLRRRRSPTEINQGQVMRSTLAFSRVTHFINKSSLSIGSRSGGGLKAEPDRPRSPGFLGPDGPPGGVPRGRGARRRH